MSASPTTRVRVRSRTEVADGVIALELERPEGSLPNWSEGAHIDVILPDGRERQYSLCSRPGEPTWRIAILREHDASAWMHENAVEGAILQVRGPSNHFMFAPTAGRRYIFIAGGIGITPILAMARRADAAGADFVLLYAGRSRRTMAFVDEVEAAHPGRVEVFPADEGRRLDLDAFLGEPRERTIVYACGPTRLIEAIEERMHASPRGSLRVERFEAKVLGPPVWTEPFEVDLMMSGMTVQVEPGISILEAVEAQGVVVPASCRTGRCGTCEVAVVDGEVEHRDSVLSAEEQEDNRTMMICVSRAACPRIMIEL